MVWGGGVGTRIRYTHCISTLCRLSTLPQYYKPPPHHRGGWGILYTTTTPQTTPTPQGGGNPLLPPPMGGVRGGGTGQHCTIYIYIYIYIILRFGSTDSLLPRRDHDVHKIPGWRVATCVWSSFRFRVLVLMFFIAF